MQKAREETSVVTQAIYQKMEFLSIPAGIFWMGEGESKVLVEIPRSFEIMSTPLTQKMWVEVMGENPSFYRKGDHGVTLMFHDKSIEMQPDHPVETVCWYDVEAFIRKLNQLDSNYDYRLPMEEEWEYAARAGTDTAYSFGDDPKMLPSYGWFDQNSNDQTHPVKELKPNAFGLYDMHGNVWEWVASRGPGRVMRGGAWDYGEESLCSGSRHSGGASGYRSSNIGTRLVRTHKLR